MIARLWTILAASLLALSISWLISCTASPPTPTVPRGSAAFASFNAPWQKDLVWSVAPVYSHDDRAAWRQGGGVFHVVIDWNTGAVVAVSVKKSTGHPSLDNAAVQALKQWRFRPRSWKTLDIPVDFKMGRTHADYREKVRKAQQQQRQL